MFAADVSPGSGETSGSGSAQPRTGGEGTTRTGGVKAQAFGFGPTDTTTDPTNPTDGGGDNEFDYFPLAIRASQVQWVNGGAEYNGEQVQQGPFTVSRDDHYFDLSSPVPFNLNTVGSTAREGVDYQFQAAGDP